MSAKAAAIYIFKFKKTDARYMLCNIYRASAMCFCCFSVQSVSNSLYGFCGGVFRGQPYGIVMPLQPCELFFCVHPCVPCYFCMGLIHGCLSAEIGGEFFVSHCVEGVVAAIRQRLAGFFLEALAEHAFHTQADAAEKFLPRVVDCYSDGVERAFDASACSQAGVGTSGLEAYFQSVDYTAGVGAVDLLPVVGIADAELCEHALEPVVGKHGKYIFSCLRGNVGQRVDSMQKGVDIHHRAAANNRQSVSVPDVTEDSQRVLLEARGTVGCLQREEAYKVMPHPRQLSGRGCGSAYGDIGIDLT